MSEFLKTAVMMAVLFWRHGTPIAAAMRAKKPRPLEDQPDWAVGIIVRTYRTSRSADARLLYATAVDEWRLRRPALRHEVDISRELWRVTVERWHDTDITKLLRMPIGGRVTGTDYAANGDRQFILISIPTGTALEVLDPELVRIERLF